MTTRFGSAVRDLLLGTGWRIVEVQAGASLLDLQRAGAPFKSTRLLDTYPEVARVPRVPCAEVAYLEDLLPESLNQSVVVGAALIEQLGQRPDLLQHGLTPALGSAALYVNLMVAHHTHTGAWLLAQRYTWTADVAGGMPVVAGAFGTQRPILLAAVPEPSGKGIGALPVIIPPGRID